MKYCPNCGAQLPDGTKFCQECGQKITAPEPVQPVYEAPQQSCAPPVQQTYEAPQQSYAPPVQQTYEAPQQSYAPPAQQSYEPPQQSYAPPVQQTYEAPQQSYTPPAQSGSSGSYTPPTQSGGGSYVPPAAHGKGSQAPKEKKPINKRIFLFAGIAVIAMVLIVVLVSCLGGKGKDDANLGRYEGVSCSVEGLSVPLEDSWVELKAKGKATINLSGDEFSGTWTLDGEKFTLKQSGDEYTGTLKDSVLDLDLSGIIYTFAKEGAEPARTETDAGKTDTGASAAAEAGYWTLLRVDGASADSSMTEEDVAMFKDMGMEIFLDLKEDGTGVLAFETPADITWAGGVITSEDGTKITYTLENDSMHMPINGDEYIFVRGEGSAPEVDTSASMGDDWGDEGDDWGESSSLYSDYWSGDWYGWYVISNANSAYEGNIGQCYDVVATISVYDDDTGYVYIEYYDGDEMCWCDVSFGPGITENGCMMSEEGSVFGFDIGHADWIVDPGASVVSEFDYMIHIEGSITDEDGDWFDYDLFLRPWGMDWEDVRVADTTDLPYDDMMPLEYDNWYLPQIDGSVG